MRSTRASSSAQFSACSASTISSRSSTGRIASSSWRPIANGQRLRWNIRGSVDPRAAVEARPEPSMTIYVHVLRVSRVSFSNDVYRFSVSVLALFTHHTTLNWVRKQQKQTLRWSSTPRLSTHTCVQQKTTPALSLSLTHSSKIKKHNQRLQIRQSTRPFQENAIHSYPHITSISSHLITKETPLSITTIAAH